MSKRKLTLQTSSQSFLQSWLLKKSKNQEDEPETASTTSIGGTMRTTVTSSDNIFVRGTSVSSSIVTAQLQSETIPVINAHSNEANGGCQNQHESRESPTVKFTATAAEGNEMEDHPKLASEDNDVNNATTAAQCSFTSEKRSKKIIDSNDSNISGCVHENVRRISKKQNKPN